MYSQKKFKRGELRERISRQLHSFGKLMPKKREALLNTYCGLAVEGVSQNQSCLGTLDLFIFVLQHISSSFSPTEVLLYFE